MKKEEDIYKKGDNVGIRGLLQRPRLWKKDRLRKKAKKQAEKERIEKQQQLKADLIKKKDAKIKEKENKIISKEQSNFYKQNFKNQPTTQANMTKYIRYMSEKQEIIYAKDSIKLIKRQKSESNKPWTNEQILNILCDSGYSLIEASKAIVFDNVMSSKARTTAEQKRIFEREKIKILDMVARKAPVKQKTIKTINKLITDFEIRDLKKITRILFNFGLRNSETQSHIEFVSKAFNQLGVRGQKQVKLLLTVFEKDEISSYLKKITKQKQI